MLYSFWISGGQTDAEVRSIRAKIPDCFAQDPQLPLATALKVCVVWFGMESVQGAMRALRRAI